MPTYAFDGDDIYRDDHNHLLERRAGASTDLDLGSIGPPDELFANAIAVVDGKVAVIHDDGKAPGVYLFDGKGGSSRIFHDDTGASWGFEMVGLGDSLYFDLSWNLAVGADADPAWTPTIERLSLDGTLHPVWTLGRNTFLQRMVGNGRYLFALAGHDNDVQTLTRIDPVSGERTVILAGKSVGTDLAVDDQWVYVLDNNLIVRIATDAPAVPDPP